MVQVLLAQLTDEPKLWSKIDKFVEGQFINRPAKTVSGIPWVGQWGSLRYASNLAFVSMVTMKLHEDRNQAWEHGVSSQEVVEHVEHLLYFILGDNPRGKSYDSFFKIFKLFHFQIIKFLKIILDCWIQQRSKKTTSYGCVMSVMASRL